MTADVAVRAPEEKTSCPIIWCKASHLHPDDAHIGAMIDMPTSEHTYTAGRVKADGTRTHGVYRDHVCAHLWQRPEDRHPLVLLAAHDQRTESWMTAGEADNLANLLKDFAEDVRESRDAQPPEPYWCNQEHGPGDGHHSIVKTVYLTSYGGLDAKELLVGTFAPPGRSTYIEICHHKGEADKLTPDEADRLGDVLALLSIAARL